MGCPSPQRRRTMHRPSTLSRRALLGLGGGLGVAAAFGTAGCAGPGSGSSGGTGTSAPLAKAPSIGTEQVTLKAYFETGFPMPKALTDEFTKQFPNVKWNIREDQFA